MSPIEQIEHLEALVMKRLAGCRRHRFFSESSFWKGWGECVRRPEGGTEPVWTQVPSVEVVGNSSTPDDDNAQRQINLRVTMTTAQDEGCEMHRCREKKMDETLCKINRANSETISRWRWTVSRFNDPDTSYQTEWTTSVSLHDPCWEC